MNDLAELYRLLEFDKVLNWVRAYLSCEMAGEYFERLQPMQEPAGVQGALDETAELQDLLQHDDPFPLQTYYDVRKELEAARIEGHFLSAEALVRVARTLQVAAKVRAYLARRHESHPALWRRAEPVVELKEVTRAVAETIDFDTLEVRDGASPKLARVRKEIHRAEQNARKVLERLFKKYAQQGYLQENLLTLREGHMVLPVKLEYKGRVPGLVVDQSSTGSTLFVEPFECVEIHNEMRRLRAEEAQEVERILRGLTDQVRAHAPSIAQNLEALAYLDAVHAKARFAVEFGCHKPALSAERVLELRNGRHPILLKRVGAPEGVTPLNLKIGDAFHTLVITGPNAGGKTVALKTVGLLCLMTQCGLLIPADPDSRIPLFGEMFVDIGDFQSIEQDLSTFTSHMSRIKAILDRADARSLVLVDEIGVGTDPEEGAALAQAFLEELTRRGAITIVTTHHGTLKEFAYHTEGVENGSMDFDVETLQPTYRFRLGIPGSSYAIEIARRLGISEAFLKRSRELVGEEKGRLEQLILELERRISEAQKLNEKLKLEKTRLQGLANLYKERYEKLQREEKSLKEKAVAEAQQLLADANARLEKAVKEIREQQASQEAIRRARQVVAEEKARLAEVAEQVREEEVPESGALTHVEPGMVVYWGKHRSHGTVLAEPDGSGKVLIQVEQFKFRVPLAELSPARETAAKPKARRGAVNVRTAPKSDLLPELHVRGQTLDEAIANTDKFLDDALLAGWSQVRIIHGKGTGTLRKGLTEFLQKHPRVKSTRLGAWNEGDLGVTVVELEV